MWFRLRTAAAAPLFLVLACLEPQPARPPGPEVVAGGGTSVHPGTGGSGGDAGGPGPGGAGASGSGGGSGGGGGSDCNDGPAIPDVKGECLDLGAVLPGAGRTATVTVWNASARRLALCPTFDDPSFSLDGPDLPGEPPSLSIAPHFMAPLPVRFRPTGVGPYESWLRLTPCAPCADTPPPTVCVRGLGADTAFLVDPSSIAFGPQPAGRQICRRIQVDNTGNVPLQVRDVQLDDSLTRTAGTFELRLGSLLSDEIPPGGFAAFQLCFHPVKSAEEYAGNLLVHGDDHVVAVSITAGGMSCFAAEPPTLDLGTGSDDVIEASVALRDVCGHAMLLEVRSDPATFELVHEALPAHLDAAGLPVTVRFDPRNRQGVTTAKLLGIIDTVSGPQTVFSVPIVARAVP